jgi:predicted XRE-type DNA-binding protein
LRRRKVRRERSVFDDLGFSPKEAIALDIKAGLHSKIVNVAKKNYSQSQLQEMLGEPQPRISDLLRGKISKFSLETLVNYAEALHMHPEIRTREPIKQLATASA